MIIKATIHLVWDPNEEGIWRPNFTTLKFEDGEEEGIEFEDEKSYKASRVEDIYPEIKTNLLDYLKKNFYSFDSEEIEVIFEQDG